MRTATNRILGATLLGALALATVGGPSAAEEPRGDPKVGDLAPAFEGVDDMGQP